MKTLIAIGLIGLAATASAQSVSPGLWHDETHATLNGRALPEARHPDGCLTPEDAKDIRSTMERRMQHDAMQCNISQWDYNAPQLTATLSCKTAQGSATLKASGTLTAESYELRGQGQGQATFTIPNQAPQTMHYTLDLQWSGRHVGACP